MCSNSKATIRDEQVSIYLGYNGGKIAIGDFKYSEYGTESTRDELISRLSVFDKEELAALIADLINNSWE